MTTSASRTAISLLLPLIAVCTLLSGCASPPVATRPATGAAAATPRAACYTPDCCDNEVALQFEPHRLNCRAISLTAEGKSAESFVALQSAIAKARVETANTEAATEVLCFALNDAAHRADARDEHEALEPLVGLELRQQVTHAGLEHRPQRSDRADDVLAVIDQRLEPFTGLSVAAHDGELLVLPGEASRIASERVDAVALLEGTSDQPVSEFSARPENRDLRHFDAPLR